MPLIPAPNHSSCFCEGIGACHFAEGRLEEAIVHFAAVAEIDPSEASLFNLANAQGKAEHSVAAAATYTPPTPNISILFLYFFMWSTGTAASSASTLTVTMQRPSLSTSLTTCVTGAAAKLTYHALWICNHIFVDCVSGRRAARNYPRSNRSGGGDICSAVQRHHSALLVR